MTKRELEVELKIAEDAVVYWKAAYLKAIKHDDRIILKQQEAQPCERTS